MKALPLLRLLTPAGWAVLAAVALASIGILGHGLGLRWDPFDLAARRLERAESRSAAAISDAAARRLETEGLADQVRRLDHIHQQTVAIERAAVLSTIQARSAHDASTPIDPARADRLARHDRELCGLVPSLCAAAAADPATGGDPALHSGPAS